MSESDLHRTTGMPGQGSGVGGTGGAAPRSGAVQDAKEQASGVASHGAEAGREVAQDAKEQASDVASHGLEAGKELAHEAKERTGEVAREVTHRARNLVDQARSEVSSQASSQQQRLTGGLRTIGHELTQMSDSVDDPGYASDLARQGSQMVERVADWFEQREPGDVMREVKNYARRSPGVFLAIAAGAGLLAGRLIRGAKDGTDGGGASGSATAGLDSTTPTTPVRVPAAAQSGVYGTTTMPPAVTPATAGLGTSTTGTPTTSTPTTGSSTTGTTPGVTPAPVTGGGTGHVSGI